MIQQSNAFWAPEVIMNLCHFLVRLCIYDWISEEDWHETND
jgi:hypothetical protein